MWREFSSIDNEILEIIQNLSILDKFIDKIPLIEIYKQIRKKNVLSESWAIKKHIKSLENKGKIKIENWSVKLL